MNLHRVESADLPAVLALAADVIGPARAGPFVRSHTERHHVTVAREAGAVVGFIAYRTDWFQCTFVSLISVHKDFRRRGVARALFKVVEDVSPDAHGARLHAVGVHRQSPAGLSRAALLQATGALDHSV